jgi:AcrR family transcriptional regulator
MVGKRSNREYRQEVADHSAPEAHSQAPADPGTGGACYTISELAALTGVRVSSIHHYRRRGLLPPPDATAPHRFIYGAAHRDVLVAIRTLRERYRLSLTAIAEILPAASGKTEPADGKTEPGAGKTEPADGALAAAAAATVPWDEIVGEYLARGSSAACQTRLLAVARDLFVARGYDGVNIAEICDAAGIAKGSFYKYFGSKDEIYLAAVRSTVDVVEAAFDATEPLEDASRATEELTRVLEPVLPLLLEVVTRSLHGDMLRGVMTDLLAAYTGLVAARLVGKARSPKATARRVADTAVIGLLRRAAGLQMLVR